MSEEKRLDYFCGEWGPCWGLIAALLFLYLVTPGVMTLILGLSVLLSIVYQFYGALGLMDLTLRMTGLERVTARTVLLIWSVVCLLPLLAPLLTTPEGTTGQSILADPVIGLIIDAMRLVLAAVRAAAFLYGVGCVVAISAGLAIHRLVVGVLGEDLAQGTKAFLLTCAGYFILMEFLALRTTALLVAGVLTPTVDDIIGSVCGISLLRIVWVCSAGLALGLRVRMENRPLPGEESIKAIPWIVRAVLAAVLGLLVVVSLNMVMTLQLTAVLILLWLLVIFYIYFLNPEDDEQD